jgi:hypothetical protein
MYGFGKAVQKDPWKTMPAGPQFKLKSEFVRMLRIGSLVWGEFMWPKRTTTIEMTWLSKWPKEERANRDLLFSPASICLLRSVSGRW